MGGEGGARGGRRLYIVTDKDILYNTGNIASIYSIITVNGACAVNSFNHVRFFMTLRSVAHQAPLSMGFFWSGLPCPPPGDLPDQGSNQHLFMSPALAGGFFTTGATWKAQVNAI